MNTTLCTLTLLLSALAASPAANATTIYRWTDADGVAQFGQQKPQDVPAQQVHLRYKSETSAEAQARLDALTKEAGLGEAAAGDGQQGEKAASEKVVSEKVAGAERKQECVIAADNLQKLGNWAKHILINDSSGNPTTMDSVQRQAAIDRIQKWRSENRCP